MKWCTSLPTVGDVVIFCIDANVPTRLQVVKQGTIANRIQNTIDERDYLSGKELDVFWFRSIGITWAELGKL